MTFTFLASAATRLFGARWLTTIVVNAANPSLTTFASNGVRAIESKIIRRSRFLSFCLLPSALCLLNVSDGLSLKTVFTPTRTASAPCRNFIPQARAFSPVIHLDSPPAVAIFPSSVIAAFTVTNGVRWMIQ